jgi:hypothetical protein
VDWGIRPLSLVQGTTISGSLQFRSLQLFLAPRKAVCFPPRESSGRLSGKGIYLICMGVGTKGPTFFEELISSNLKAEKVWKKSVFLSKGLER